MTSSQRTSYDPSNWKCSLIFITPVCMKRGRGWLQPCHRVVLLFQYSHILAYQARIMQIRKIYISYKLKSAQRWYRAPQNHPSLSISIATPVPFTFKYIWFWVFLLSQTNISMHSDSNEYAINIAGQHFMATTTTIDHSSSIYLLTHCLNLVRCVGGLMKGEIKSILCSWKDHYLWMFRISIVKAGNASGNNDWCDIIQKALLGCSTTSVRNAA